MSQTGDHYPETIGKSAVVAHLLSFSHSSANIKTSLEQNQITIIVNKVVQNKSNLVEMAIPPSPKVKNVATPIPFISE
jgi:hypothetical protein